jgi:hypothetical protein
MGCDIHSHAERKNARDEWEIINDFKPFEWRRYGLFGFLADVRNYSRVPPIAERRGIPDDSSLYVAEDYEDEGEDAHSASWLLVSELMSFNYDACFEDRRETRELEPNLRSSACTSSPGSGRKTTYREFLGEDFFDELRNIQSSGAERIIFWFDN